MVQVDAGTDGQAISPLIYGVATASPDELRQLGASIDRWGGNPSSRYNWVNGHAWNAARDWEFRNVNYGGQPGSAADRTIQEDLSASVAPLITIPTLGWVAKDASNDSRSLNVPGEGGPPLSPGSDAIKGYDPTANRVRTSVPSFARKPGPFVDSPPADSPAVYQDEWVSHLLNRFGSGPKGLQYFAMDNEPDLWSAIHTDVHPVRTSYESMVANFEEYSTAVKAVDPAAKVLGPDVSGWTAYQYSTLDAGSDNFATHADRNAHGGVPFLKWWLGQIAKKDRAAGKRTLDYLDVHYYPQAAGVYSASADAATRALRIRSTRSLDDPSYQDESWIGQPVHLIPLLKSWIASEYPGTGLSISEYDWGGQMDASGAVALAEVLGRFGRDGVDMASYWTFPPVNSPAGGAFRIYRNFDGKGGAFGDRSLTAKVNRPGLAAFAARHSSGGAVDVVLVNESLTASAQVALSIAGAPDRQAVEHLLAGGSSVIELRSIPSLGQSITLPPLSVALIEVPKS